MHAGGVLEGRGLGWGQAPSPIRLCAPSGRFSVPPRAEPAPQRGEQVESWVFAAPLGPGGQSAGSQDLQRAQRWATAMDAAAGSESWGPGWRLSRQARGRGW